MWELFLSQLDHYHALELTAALAGTYYLIKVKPKDFTLILVLHLYFTLFIETVALYASIAYYSNYTFFSFIKDTPFERNYWLYNIYMIVEFFVYIYYFKSKLENKVLGKVVGFLLVSFVIAAILHNLFSGTYFLYYSHFQTVVGSLVLFVSIGFYYLEILRSEKILYFYKLLPFYISVGTLLFFLCTTPMFIYSGFFTSQSPEYIKLYKNVLLFSNVFLYGMFIFGFIKCANVNKKFVKKTIR